MGYSLGRSKDHEQGWPPSFVCSITECATRGNIKLCELHIPHQYWIMWRSWFESLFISTEFRYPDFRSSECIIPLLYSAKGYFIGVNRGRRKKRERGKKRSYLLMSMLIKGDFKFTEIQTLSIIMGETRLFYQLVGRRADFAVCPGNNTIRYIKSTWKLVSTLQYVIYLVVCILRHLIRIDGILNMNWIRERNKFNNIV